MENTTTCQIVCPHCGATKLVTASDTPWYKTDAVLWSDGRIESDGWCEPARIQQCPSCKRYFILPGKSEREEVQLPCDDTGRLPLQSLKQAIVELSGDDKTVEWARNEAWQAYNAEYRDVHEEVIPVEDKEFNRSNMQWLLDYYCRETPNYSFLKFELLRLLGYTEEYRKLLADMTFERFVEWWCARFKKRGVTDYSPDEELLKRLYSRRVKQLTESLQKPMRPFVDE